METTLVSSLLPYPKILFNKRRVFPLINFSGTILFSCTMKFLTITYNNNLENDETKNMKEALTSMTDERVEKLLNRKEKWILLAGEDGETKEPNRK